MKKEKKRDWLIIPLLILAIGGGASLMSWLLSNYEKNNREAFDREFEEYMQEKESERKELESNFIEGMSAVYKITDKKIKTDRVVIKGLPIGKFNAPFLKIWDKQSDEVYWIEVTKDIYDRVGIGEELSVIVAENQASVKLVDYNDSVFKQIEKTEE